MPRLRHNTAVLARPIKWSSIFRASRRGSVTRFGGSTDQTRVCVMDRLHASGHGSPNVAIRSMPHTNSTRFSSIFGSRRA